MEPRRLVLRRRTQPRRNSPAPTEGEDSRVVITFGNIERMVNVPCFYLISAAVSSQYSKIPTVHRCKLVIAFFTAAPASGNSFILAVVKYDMTKFSPLCFRNTCTSWETVARRAQVVKGASKRKRKREREQASRNTYHGRE